MTCAVCGKPVKDKRRHRHRKENEALRLAENLGRETARLERHLLWQMRGGRHEFHA
jgi:hypothetical protein